MAKKSKRVPKPAPINDPSLTHEQIHQWFDRFAWPILRPCRTPHQTQSALAIAQVLWLRLVTGTDTESQITQDLEGMLHHRHDDIVAVGSLYFYRMKIALTQCEQDQLKDYFGHEAHWVQWLRELPSMRRSSVMH
jgi:hypothetical protein